MKVGNKNKSLEFDGFQIRWDLVAMVEFLWVLMFALDAAFR